MSDLSSEPPKWVERASCVIVGVVAGGAGGYVAFERSNQLGSAVLLIIGGVFLIIGIQGTRLMRFTSPTATVELEQKRRIIANAVEKAQDEGNIEKASGIAEGAAIVVPTLSAYNQGLQYELQVTAAVVGMGYFVTQQYLQGTGFDLSITDLNSQVVYAELKNHIKPIQRSMVDALAVRASRTPIPLILITNSELTRTAQEFFDTTRAFEVVQWRDENDNNQLAETLRRMFSSIPETYGKNTR